MSRCRVFEFSVMIAVHNFWKMWLTSFRYYGRLSGQDAVYRMILWKYRYFFFSINTVKATIFLEHVFAAAEKSPVVAKGLQIYRGLGSKSGTKFLFLNSIYWKFIWKSVSSKREGWKFIIKFLMRDNINFLGNNISICYFFRGIYFYIFLDSINSSTRVYASLRSILFFFSNNWFVMERFSTTFPLNSTIVLVPILINCALKGLIECLICIYT